MNEQIKFCKDCKWSGLSANFCHSPNNGTTLVDGSSKVRFSEVNRGDSYFGLPTCGSEGKWWEPVKYYKEEVSEKQSYWQKVKTLFAKKY
jgi:hypothetical protein